MAALDKVVAADVLHDLCARVDLGPEDVLHLADGIFVEVLIHDWDL